MSLRDRIQAYADACVKRPATLHFAIKGDSRSFCSKTFKTIYCEYIDPLPVSRNRWGNYGHSHDYWVLRRTHFDTPGRKRLTLCSLCKGELARRIDAIAATALSSRRVEPAPAADAPPEKDWMAAPVRPPGTEGMTGHIDEGSPTGLCGEGWAGFKTSYMPWIDCDLCLVRLDEYLQDGLISLRGFYAVAVGDEMQSQGEGQ